jgi:O-antigen/teichoic acid export membrane protein
MNSADPAIVPVTPRQPWYKRLAQAPVQSTRAFLTLVVAVATAWQLGAENFGELQAALAASAVLCVISGLSLHDCLARSLRAKPEDAASILGTGMGLQAIAATLSYVVLVFALSGQTGTVKAIWLVAGLSTVLQIPLITIGARLKAGGHTREIVNSELISLGAGILIVAFMISRNASAVWFSTASILQLPIAGLLLFWFHSRHAPAEDAFDWSNSYAKAWLRGLAKPLLIAVSAVAAIPFAQVASVWSSGAAEAGKFALAACVFQAAYAIASLLAAPGSDAATDEDSTIDLSLESKLRQLSRAGWIAGAAAVAITGAAAWLVAGSTFRGAEYSAAVLGLCLPITFSGIIRDEFWLRSGKTKQVVQSRFAGIVVTVVATAILGRYLGGLGTALATLLGVATANLAATRLVKDGHALASLQLQALFTRPPKPSPKAALTPPAPQPVQVLSISLDSASQNSRSAEVEMTR